MGVLEILCQSDRIYSKGWTMNQTLDLTDALEQIKAGAKIEGKDGVLAPLIKQLTEAALQVLSFPKLQ